WAALESHERALSLGHDPSLWIPLAGLYVELGLTAHALRAARRAIRFQPDHPVIDDLRLEVAAMEQYVQETAEELGLPANRFEQGVRVMEQGQRALYQHEYRASIAASRQAIKLLGDWPPPHNNLSVTLFFDGQPEGAIARLLRVLEQYPDNIHALSNAIQFLVWTGRREEAAALWVGLRAITPEIGDLRAKAADAAAAMEDDARVYELLEPLAGGRGVRPDLPGLDWRGGFFHAVAEANLGRRGARRRLRAFLAGVPGFERWLVALDEGKPGPGWAERFPYFAISDLLPRSQVQAFVELLGREEEMSPERFQREIDRFVERFPQLAVMGEKIIWEEMEPEAGVMMLAAVGTPQAHAALRRYGLSQAGDDDSRMEALLRLAEAGEIPPDETLRVWQEGAWREVEVRGYLIGDDEGPEHSPEAARALQAGLEAFRREDLDQAERLLLEVVDLEPEAKGAYNNLGALYARRGEHDRAKEMFRAALEIDPLYVYPCCNLVNYLLDEGDVAGAMEMLRPLADRTRFQPQEMALYAHTEARVLIKQEELEAARDTLAMAEEVAPGYEPVQELLQRLESILSDRGFVHSFWEDQRKRDRAKRRRLQAGLTTADPTLAEALPLLTKNALTGTAREVLPWGGWSALRKAELIERLIEGLTDRDSLKDVISALDEEEGDALREVLARGGHMPWQAFDEAYGNDLDESRYWNWHEPETTMGRLRLHGLLVEAMVEGELVVAVPRELRPLLKPMLA
ncbi:MAG: tetratricopeptide repeat protein, partial [Anaerolineae bacterium]